MPTIWTLIALLSVLSSTLADDNDTDLIDYKALFGDSPRRDLPFPDLVKYDNYPVEVHNVTTSDGYILSLFRIPLNNSCEPDESKVPHIFMHGLYLTADDCIIPGPGKAHCYIYADNCLDVWVPNNRGNRYSRNHVSLNPDKDPEFWDFTVDEMALYDLPAIIDYILDNTGKSQVSYVAHSQGVATLLMLCAKKPEYNAKIKVGFGLSTTAYLEHSRFLLIPFQGIAADLMKRSDNTNFEFVAHGSIVQKTGKLLCGLNPLQYPFCSVLVFAALGYNRFQITDETLRVVTGHTPGGTSYKDFLRWGQMRNNGFAEYDYGISGNLKKYGRFQPPLIDLSAITMKWYFISSYNDFVGDVRDIAKLMARLSNVTQCILADKTFGHLDFIYGKDIPNYITPKVLSVLKGEGFPCDGDCSST